MFAQPSSHDFDLRNSFLYVFMKWVALSIDVCCLGDTCEVEEDGVLQWF